MKSFVVSIEHGGHKWLQTKNLFHEFCGYQLWIFIGHLSGVLHRILFLSFYVQKIFFLDLDVRFCYTTQQQWLSLFPHPQYAGNMSCEILLLRKSLYKNHSALLSHFRPQAHFSLEYCDGYGNRLKTLPQIISKEFKRVTLKKLWKTLQKIIWYGNTWEQKTILFPNGSEWPTLKHFLRV